MAEVALGDDRTASVESAWSTDEGGLALRLDRMETPWSEGQALLPLSRDELEQALASEGATASDLSALPVRMLSRARLDHEWSPGRPGGPTLTHEVAVERSERRSWIAAVPPGREGVGPGRATRIVYCVDHPAPDDQGERLLACMVVSTERDGGVRRAVFVVEGLDRGPLRVAALIGFGVLVDIALVALLVA